MTLNREASLRVKEARGAAASSLTGKTRWHQSAPVRLQRLVSWITLPGPKPKFSLIMVALTTKDSNCDWLESGEESLFPPAHKSRGLGSQGLVQKCCKGERADCMWHARASSRSIWSQGSSWRTHFLYMLPNCSWRLAHWKTCQVWTSQIVQGAPFITGHSWSPPQQCLCAHAEAELLKAGEFLPSSTKSCPIDCRKTVTWGKKYIPRGSAGIWESAQTVSQT